ncbi:hypothetical protein J6590_105960 [Homalodisca vitripennis]|nr:hypothetical protein J6590_105960 [Homalodisca vitripennis]
MSSVGSQLAEHTTESLLVSAQGSETVILHVGDTRITSRLSIGILKSCPWRVGNDICMKELHQAECATARTMLEKWRAEEICDVNYEPTRAGPWRKRGFQILEDQLWLRASPTK